ncbi:MAG: NAD+ synthase [Candidatus Poseidoniales archaeon]
MSMIALLQMDATIGDLYANQSKLMQLSKMALSHGATLAVSTELAICGYPPRDLLLEPEFVQSAFETAKQSKPAIPMLIGTPIPPEHERKKPTNGVVKAEPQTPTSLQATSIVAHKQLLPTYDVFDEARYFDADARTSLVRSLGGFDLGVTICEDAWQSAGLTPSTYASDPIEHLSQFIRQGVDLHATVNLSASPYHQHKGTTRIKVCRNAAKTLGHPFLLANQVGGNDDLLFDGRSMVAWPDGTIVVAPAWREGVLLVDLANPDACQWVDADYEGALLIGHRLQPQKVEAQDDGVVAHEIHEVVEAVTTGLADYCRKSSIKGIVLGLSGGIDSAVAACIAQHALGSERVVGISMPSRFSSEHSKTDAEHTAKALGITYITHSIEGLHNAAEETLGQQLAQGYAVAGENIQARLRALIVMAYANSKGYMAISTGNKSEIAQGYCTLYGDMAGGYCPLGDVYKMEVYAIAEWFNQYASEHGKTPPVSQGTLTKPPSAELDVDQKDEDTLPPYPLLDAILRHHIEEGASQEELVSLGYDEDIVLDVLVRLERNEHKRWQMAPAPRVSSRAFGQGWRRPLASNHEWRSEHRQQL